MGTNHSDPALLGVAALARRVFGGEDLLPLAVQILARLDLTPDLANLRMDLATMLQLLGQPELSAFHLQQALRTQQRYHLPARRPGGPRLLALMRPGNLMANTPLPFLLEGSDISLDLLFVGPDLPLPTPSLDHDVLFNAISHGEHATPILTALQPILAAWPRPIINPPEAISGTARDLAYQRLAGIPGLVSLPTARVHRDWLAAVVQTPDLLPSVLEDGQFPLIIRPLDSHAGQALEKLETPVALAAYLGVLPNAEFFISRFYDYRSPDGFFRKYRVAVIDGHSFASHMGVSEHWMIHYLNAGMAESAWKRGEEAAWMASYAETFAPRHQAALAHMAERTGLDYFVVDCAETPAGELLVFEFDPAAIVHDMDPVELYPYKHPAMAKLFAAFHAMVRRRAGLI